MSIHLPPSPRVPQSILSFEAINTFVTWSNKNHSYALWMIEKSAPHTWENGLSCIGLSDRFLEVATTAALKSKRPEDVKCMTQFLQWSYRFFSLIGEKSGTLERFHDQLDRIRVVVKRLIPHQHTLTLNDFAGMVQSSISKQQYPLAHQQILKIQRMIDETTDQFGLHVKILRTVQELHHQLSKFWEIPCGFVPFAPEKAAADSKN